MNRKRNPLLAGIFIVVSLLVAIGIVVAIKGVSYFLDPVDIRYVSFALRDDLGGLAVGDDVRIGGYTVGHVRGIELVSPGDSRITGFPPDQPKPASEILLVSISVPRKYILRRGARVAVQSTVTGQSNLNFESIGAGEPLLPSAVLVGRPGALAEILSGVAEMKPRVTGILAQLDEKTIPAATGTFEKVRDPTVPRLNDTFDEFRITAKSTTATVEKVKGQVDPALAKYNLVADAAKAMMDRIGELFGDVKVDFRTLIANLSTTSGSIKEKVPGILDKTDNAMAKVNDTLANAQDALADIKVSAASIKAITGEANSIVVENSGRIDAMMESLKNTSRNLEGASVEIRHSPWRLLYQPKESELSNLNLFDSARAFATGAANLNDAAQALRDAIRSGKADESQIQTLLRNLQGQFDKFHQAENGLWEQIKP